MMSEISQTPAFATRLLLFGLVLVGTGNMASGQATNDLWDVSTGTVIGSFSPLVGPSQPAGAFGGNGGPAEPTTTIFFDNQPAGTVHSIQWNSPPRDFNRVVVYGASDGGGLFRSFNHVRLLAKHLGSSTYDITLYDGSVSVPYHNNRITLDLALPATITASAFRAEFTQTLAGSLSPFVPSGPRIVEIDAFGPTSLWDVSVGATVTNASALNAAGSSSSSMLGGRGGVEPYTTLFTDGLPAGSVHFVEWSTPMPTTVGAVAVYASADFPTTNRSFNRVKILAASAGSATFDQVLVDQMITVPYSQGGWVELRVPLSVAAVATNFRAEFTQGGALGPRVHQVRAYPPSCPVISIQPVSVTVCDGSSTLLTISEAGTGPFTYHWRKDFTPIDIVANPSASTAALTLSNVGPDDAAFYDCVVTNSCGSVTSNAAALTICRCLTCAADFNEDGGVDGGDVGTFFAAWESGVCDADVNQDGGVDGDDVSVFFAQWESGGC